MSEPVQQYIMVSHNGGIVAGTNSSSEHTSKWLAAEIAFGDPSDENQRKIESMGYRVVRVEIREVK